MPVMTEDRRLTLPPPYRQHRLDAGDPMAEAIRRAPGEGAGALVWRLGGQVLSFAVVLEPEEPLATARLAFLAGMAALADALAAHCPAERSVRFGWPDAVFYDAARLGGGRLALPPGCAEGTAPDWMVFGAELIADRDHLEAPGDRPDSISLKEEAFEDPAAIVESFAAYLMLHFDRWTHEGEGAVTSRYLDRLDPPGAERRIGPGVVLEEGGRRVTLAEGLAASAWRGSGGPRL